MTMTLGRAKAAYWQWDLYGPNELTRFLRAETDLNSSRSYAWFIAALRRAEQERRASLWK
ncbi:hypothetical protein Pth03_44730 [Planotetraspora thailandica]|uniref:Uncharacterized protein n=1 Tax=Planotetraspora thailandica TaxID=487172 RepID=A0A8J3V8P9_9ACTN|nr:hypothetical protein Pth03_44730 [Planotetraspora thailandica]